MFAGFTPQRHRSDRRQHQQGDARQQNKHVKVFAQDNCQDRRIVRVRIVERGNRQRDRHRSERPTDTDGEERFQILVTMIVMVMMVSV